MASSGHFPEQYGHSPQVCVFGKRMNGRSALSQATRSPNSESIRASFTSYMAHCLNSISQSSSLKISRVNLSLKPLRCPVRPMAVKLSSCFQVDSTQAEPSVLPPAWDSAQEPCVMVSITHKVQVEPVIPSSHVTTHYLGHSCLTPRVITFCRKSHSHLL